MIPTSVSYDPTKTGTDMTEVITWLVYNIGYGVMEDNDAWRADIKWSAWLNYHNRCYAIEFRHPEDATSFLLRWS